MTVDRKALPWLLILAAVSGYFLNAATRQPRYMLAPVGNSSLVIRIDTETGKGETCIPTRRFRMVCGADADLYHEHPYQE